MTAEQAETPAAAKNRQETAYHIFEKGVHPDHGAVYQLVIQNVQAPNAKAAIRQHVGTAKKQAGTFVAVPARSWVEVAVKVETTTTVKLG